MPLQSPNGGSTTKTQHQRSWRLRRDYRILLPRFLSRFTGYRPPDSKAPYDPIPPLRWLKSIPMKHEVWFFGWLGSFVGILLIEAIMTTNTAFRDLFRSPVIVASFGATAVLVFGIPESPLAQPRNAVGGQVLSAIVGTAITRLFALDPRYMTYLDNQEFHGTVFINGAICMSTAILAMFITGTLHPPAGATALIAAVDATAVHLSWRYIPVVLTSGVLMVSWALLINNLGRRRYPVFWWAAGRTLVMDPPPKAKDDVEQAAHGSHTGHPAPSANGGPVLQETENPARV